jgi:oligopeptide transport system substrate-binding protein
MPPRFSPSIILSLAIASALVSPGCTREGPYFGKTTPPLDQRLVYIIGPDLETLDPGRTTGGFEWIVIPALFEGLTSYHPATAEPMAALATHYETNADLTQYTFYLRGHPSPRGTKLPNTDTLQQQYLAGKLKEDFSRGHAASPDRIPARWSDGTLITAHDFVYSWRRVVDPATATPQYAYLFDYIRNAKQTYAGKLKSEALAVRALNDFAFQVDLGASTPFFLQLTSHRIFAPVPQQAIEAAQRRGRESSWTEPGHMVTSGAFILREHHPYDKIVVAKNPHYYEAGLVVLDQITFVNSSEGTNTVNLYRTGEVHAMTGERLPQLFLPALEGKRDFHSAPAFFLILPAVNTRKAPFDNVFLRYALNMATDKKEVADFLGAGRIPAQNFVAPINGYNAPKNLPVEVDGKTYDVLAYNPAGARKLLGRAGFPNGPGHDGRRLTIEYLFSSLPYSQPIAEILQQQWRRNLNIEMRLVKEEFKVWVGDYIAGNFSVTETGGGG